MKFKNINVMSDNEKKEFTEYVRNKKIKNLAQFTEFIKSFENKAVQPAKLKDYIKAFNELRN